MERLLVSHNGRLFAAFKLDLRNFRKQFWLRISSRVTIAANSAYRIRIFLHQLNGQGCSSISRPYSLVRRMLRGFRQRLCRVVTLNASDWLGAVSAAIFRNVIEVVKGDLTEFRVFPENDGLGRFLCILSGCIELTRRETYAD
jgi:hypothetical protein